MCSSLPDTMHSYDMQEGVKLRNYSLRRAVPCQRPTFVSIGFNGQGEVEKTLRKLSASAQKGEAEGQI
jgi:hypothetical protein